MVKPNKTVCFVISVILRGPVGSYKAFLSEGKKKSSEKVLTQVKSSKTASGLCYC